MSLAVVRLGLLVISTPCAYAGMTTALLRAVGRARVIETHSHAEESTALTLKMLDANKDGRIDPNEIMAFARKEGLDADTATEDFTELDTDGDGGLDAGELLQVSGAKQVNATGASSAAVLKLNGSQAQAAAYVVKGPSSQKPTSIKTGSHGARISIQDKVSPKQNSSLSPRVQLATTPPTVAAPSVESLETKTVPEAAKPVIPAPPTPLDRMVTHFAKVLRNADIIPMHEDTIKLAKKYVTPAAGYQEGDNITRVTVQSAAKEVSEQLFIAETAEARARVLDRKAAEERANATVLAKVTTQEALNAAASAAHKRANELLAQIAKLEDQAERAQVRSAALHSKAKLETEEASELMFTADKALNPASSKTSFLQA